MKEIGLFWLFLGIARVFAQNDAQVLYEKAEDAFYKEKYKKCAKLCAKMETEMPNSPYIFQANEYLGKSLLKIGKEEEGVQLLYELLQPNYSFHYAEIWSIHANRTILDTGDTHLVIRKKEGVRKRLIGIHLSNYLEKVNRYDESFRVFLAALKYPYSGCHQQVAIMRESVPLKFFNYYEEVSYPDSVFIKLLPYLFDNSPNKTIIAKLFQQVQENHSKMEMMQAWETFFEHLEMEMGENFRGEPTPYYKSQMFGIQIHLPYEYGGEAYKETLIQVLKKSYFYVLCEKW
jgi:hypothetical protein